MLVRSDKEPKRLAESGRSRFSAQELQRFRGRIAWIFAVNPPQGRRLRVLLDRVEASLEVGA